MREKAREREEHPGSEERLRTNGRARRNDAHGPPRRPSNYVSHRPPKRPRGRIAKSFMRLLGLLATAVLLAVGVTVVLMVTRDNGTDPPGDVRRAEPHAGADQEDQDARAPRGPQAHAGAEGLARRGGQATADQGFEPVSLAVYKPRESLRVLIGRPKASSGIRGRRAFFFVRGDYLGTDAASPSLRVRVARQRGSVVTLVYTLFSPGDKESKPTGGVTECASRWPTGGSSPRTRSRRSPAACPRSLVDAPCAGATHLPRSGRGSSASAFELGEAEIEPATLGRFNVCPTEDILVVTHKGPRAVRWGLVPSYAKSLGKAR